ncbi:LOB domain-containing protein 41-like [Andrographis paniculata]|uniref:LOB domain-containing protein 41-like n=1 Tax=Andrographis paniculata TaxID=175694 RepID=UPI0021E7A129|nr:LOB domain-containing protein 41-like [Andrographis paniculata]
MRISCNGCRVLRKGCSDTCSIRPCLDWIKSPESQANATVFLAKFYGRAGLINLINGGPTHLRPAIFTSLLYEACGRIVNPIYGSAGLLTAGNWQLCQRAVEAVLNGAPITPLAVDAAETKAAPPMKAYDIRHVNRELSQLSESNNLHRVRRPSRFKRSARNTNRRSRIWVGSGDESGRDDVHRSPSHDSSLSHQSEAAEPNVERESRATESLASDGAPEPALDSSGDGDVDLDLALGFKSFKRCNKPPKDSAWKEGAAAGKSKIELGLDYPAA